MEKYIQRWIVDISNWNPSFDALSNGDTFLMSLLPNHQHSSISRFLKLDDRKRAYVSKLLQYALVHQLLSIPFHQIFIHRTDHGKPFLVHDEILEFPNFNFNVSHHGDYVAIASEPVCIVGVDIVSHSIPTNETAEEFIRNFSAYFSSLEWHHVISARNSDDMLKIFYRYWSLKEAFVKAIGAGVGYKLDDVEFQHTTWDNIYVKVAGKELKDWKFWLCELGQNYSVSVARGPPRMAIESYRRTLNQMEFGENEYSLTKHLPNPSFTVITVDELVKLCRQGHMISSGLSDPHICDDDEECRKIK